MKRAAIHLGVGSPPPLVVTSDMKDMAVGLTGRRFARNGVKDAQRLCERIGITEQHCLLESDATEPALRAAIEKVAPDRGLLVVSFAGHGRQLPDADPGNPRHDVGWLLFDRVLPESELVHMFDGLPEGATVVLVGDHCFGLGELSTTERSIARPPKVVSISAIDDIERRTMTGTTLMSLIEQAMFEPDACPTNEELARRLRVQSQLNPKVWCSEPGLWARPPFV